VDQTKISKLKGKALKAPEKEDGIVDEMESW